MNAKRKNLIKHRFNSKEPFDLGAQQNYSCRRKKIVNYDFFKIVLKQN